MASSSGGASPGREGMGAGRRRTVVIVVGAGSAERVLVAGMLATVGPLREAAKLGDVQATLIAESSAVIVIAPDHTPTAALVSAIRRFRVVDPATAILLCLRTGDRPFISCRRWRGPDLTSSCK